MNLMMFLPGANKQSIEEFARILNVKVKALPLTKAKVALTVFNSHYSFSTREAEYDCRCSICETGRRIIAEIETKLKQEEIANDPNNNSK